MIAGTTKSGFHFNVNEKIISDWRLINAIADTQAPDEMTKVKGAVNMVKIIVGGDSEALSAHVMGEDGTVQIDDIMREVGEIMDAMKEASSEVKKY